jgi:DNA repair protein SbcC/Rad50
MRILSVRFKNLNSLAGEWEVDFTHPSYTTDGIFAITGPTGAGKTTLLDAICLGLYGETPRLGKITQSSNEIMSRHTGECFAEVSFSTQHGTFRCHWSQHRARKHANGKLQITRHEIADASTGKIIDNQIRTVAGRIVKTTGMDFGRFTQSMMLAQGGFAAFLKASADDRAPILEQITGTEIYSDISRLVHTRFTESRNALHLLESELKGMQLLTPEQEAQHHTDEQQLTTELRILLTQEAKTRQQRDWKKLCLDLQDKASRLAHEQASWQTRDAAFASQREILAHALKALELSADYASITSLRAEQHGDEQQLDNALNALPLLQEKTATSQQLCNAADISRQTAEAKLRDMRPVFRQVHLLDQQITQAGEKEQTLSLELDNQQAEYQTREQTITSLQQTIGQKTQQLAGKYPEAGNDLNLIIDIAKDKLTLTRLHNKTLEDQLAGHLQGKDLKLWRQLKTDVESRCNQLAILHERLAQRTSLQGHISTLSESILESIRQLQSLSVALTDTTALVKAHEKTLAALQQQQIQQQRILSLEEQRRQLLAGEPCPLCGSTEHPFAAHEPLADELETEFINAQKRLGESQQRLKETSKQHIQLQTQVDHDEKQLQRETDALQELDESLKGMSDKLGIKYAELSDQALHTVNESLRCELEKIQRTVEAADKLESDIRQQDKLEAVAIQSLNDTLSDIKEIEFINTGITEHRARLSALDAAIESQRVVLATSQLARSALQEKRRSLLGEHDPEQQEAILESALAAAQTSHQQQKSALTQAEQELRDLQQSINTLEQRVDKRIETINSLTRDFVNRINSQGFTSEEQYLAARLGETERRQLQHENEALTRRGIELQAAIQENQRELADQVALNLSADSLEILQQQLAELEQKSGKLQQDLGGIRQTLRNNEQQRQQQQMLAQKIDQQKIEADRWGRLHELIGSADGKKFRNFAQGLTLDMMIAQANQQLQKMSERYLLQRDPLQSLDLNVIDNFQAGEIRSTKNLSGGESFIVSLALALGLSRMASRNVRVDSLFLDEGFGTLDEEALDTALETLASLQQEGKLIGVISHVSALKERIATQIRVSPSVGGRSTINGPGCRAL